MSTSLYAGILGLIYLKITFDTIMIRRTKKVSLGSGKSNEILHMTSAHNNFSNYAPFFLILFYLAEMRGFSQITLHIIAMFFILGRLFHYYYMKYQEKSFTKRQIGMIFTLIPIALLSIINIVFIFMSK